MLVAFAPFLLGLSFEWLKRSTEDKIEHIIVGQIMKTHKIMSDFVLCSYAKYFAWYLSFI